jgi:hypothetical protein
MVGASPGPILHRLAHDRDYRLHAVDVLFDSVFSGVVVNEYNSQELDAKKENLSPNILFQY